MQDSTNIDLSNTQTVKDLKNSIEQHANTLGTNKETVKIAKELVQDKQLEDIEVNGANIDLNNIVENINNVIDLENIGFSKFSIVLPSGGQDEATNSATLLATGVNKRFLSLLLQQNVTDEQTSQIQKGEGNEGYKNFDQLNQAIKNLKGTKQTILGQQSIIITSSSTSSAHTISILLKVDAQGKKEVFLCLSSNQIAKNKKAPSKTEEEQVKLTATNEANEILDDCTNQERGQYVANQLAELSDAPKFTEKKSREKTIEDIGFFANLLHENGWGNALQNAKILQPCNQWSNVSCANASLIGATRVTLGDRSVQSYYNLEQSDYTRLAEDYIDIATFIRGDKEEIKNTLQRTYQHVQREGNHTKTECDQNLVNKLQLKKIAEPEREKQIEGDERMASTLAKENNSINYGSTAQLHTLDKAQQSNEEKVTHWIHEPQYHQAPDTGSSHQTNQTFLTSYADSNTSSDDDISFTSAQSQLNDDESNSPKYYTVINQTGFGIPDNVRNGFSGTHNLFGTGNRSVGRDDFDNLLRFSSSEEDQRSVHSEGSSVASKSDSSVGYSSEEDQEYTHTDPSSTKSSGNTISINPNNDGNKKPQIPDDTKNGISIPPDYKNEQKKPNKNLIKVLACTAGISILCSIASVAIAFTNQNNEKLYNACVKACLSFLLIAGAAIVGLCCACISRNKEEKQPASSLKDPTVQQNNQKMMPSSKNWWQKV